MPTPLLPHQIEDARAYIENRAAPCPVTGCWHWMLSLTSDGYPQAKFAHVKIAGHRLSYIAFNGSLERGVVVRHRCDVPICVNPTHLLAGSVADNQADMVARGRSLSGERNSMANLTTEQVLEILADTRPYMKICADYGIWKGTVSAIKTGRSWGAITGVKFNA